MSFCSRRPLGTPRRREGWPPRPLPPRGDADWDAFCRTLLSAPADLVREPIQSRLLRAGTPPALIFAFMATGQFVTLHNAHRWAPADIARWGAALRAGGGSDRWFLTRSEIQLIVGVFRDAHLGLL